jgi:hypothetical protein
MLWLTADYDIDLTLFQQLQSSNYTMQLLGNNHESLHQSKALKLEKVLH